MHYIFKSGRAGFPARRERTAGHLHWFFAGSLCILFFVSLPALQAQADTPTGSTPATSSTVTPGSDEPVPYEADEFPDWAHKLRRGEIIALGSTPITFLVTFFAWDFIRFGVSGGSPNYNPFSSTNQPYSDGEKIGVIVTACSLSLCIALIDYWIGEVQEKKERRLKGKTLDASAR